MPLWAPVAETGDTDDKGECPPRGEGWSPASEESPKVGRAPRGRGSDIVASQQLETMRGESTGRNERRRQQRRNRKLSRSDLLQPGFRSVPSNSDRPIGRSSPEARSPTGGYQRRGIPRVLAIRPPSPGFPGACPARDRRERPTGPPCNRTDQGRPRYPWSSYRRKRRRCPLVR